MLHRLVSAVGRDQIFLRVALAAGLIIRLAVLSQTSAFGTPIIDEQHYVALAGSLVRGDGFANAAGQPTSIRPPLFPGLVAAVWSVVGEGHLQAVRAVNIALSLVGVFLVFQLGTRLFDPRTARYAAGIYWLYPSLVVINFLVLTETLFTVLLLLFVLLAVTLVRTRQSLVAVACGVALGLSALTRSILWPLPLLLCPLLLLVLPSSMVRRVSLAALVLVGYGAVVGPWAIRNTRLQGTLTVVDTMGGMNLRMGNYEHTPWDRMWDVVSLTGEKNWAHDVGRAFPDRLPTEGEKDKWAQRLALEYMRSHPALTLRRAFVKFADFWGLEREFLAGVSQGIFRVPTWVAAVAAVTMLVAFVGVTCVGTAGIWLKVTDVRTHVLVLLPLLVIVGIHSIVFGHSRYHLPLMPFLGIYACALVTTLRETRIAAARWRWVGAVATVCLFVGIWVRQIILVDAERLRALVSFAGL